MTSFVSFQGLSGSRLIVERKSYAETKQLLDKYRQHTKDPNAGIFGVTETNRKYKLSER